jgi:hypothetical protein
MFLIVSFLGKKLYNIDRYGIYNYNEFQPILNILENIYNKLKTTYNLHYNKSMKEYNYTMNIHKQIYKIDENFEKTLSNHLNERKDDITLNTNTNTYTYNATNVFLKYMRHQLVNDEKYNEELNQVLQKYYTLYNTIYYLIPPNSIFNYDYCNFPEQRLFSYDNIIYNIEANLIMLNKETINWNIQLFDIYTERFCFTKNTKIIVKNNNTKNIQDIQIGDYVLSLNEKTKQNEYKKVINTYKNINNKFVKYTFSNNETIICTQDHPFYNEQYEYVSYIPNKYLNTKPIYIGTICLDKNNNKIKLEQIEEIYKTQNTYIFTVEDNHNFYANTILVHNK